LPGFPPPTDEPDDKPAAANTSGPAQDAAPSSDGAKAIVDQAARKSDTPVSDDKDKAEPQKPRTSVN